jgi:hypothetical protein
MLYSATPSCVVFYGVIWILAAIVWYSAVLYGGWPCLRSLSHSFTLDFIIPGSSAALLATEVRPLVEQCLRERGLTLAPAKTTLTPIADGCDFLGHTMRQ